MTPRPTHPIKTTYSVATDPDDVRVTECFVDLEFVFTGDPFGLLANARCESDAKFFLGQKLQVGGVFASFDVTSG
jgi:hypothetical protein